MFFAPMGRFQLESIYLYFPPSSQLLYLCFCPVVDNCPSQETEVTSTPTRPVDNDNSNERPTGQKHKYNSWDDGGK